MIYKNGSGWQFDLSNLISTIVIIATALFVYFSTIGEVKVSLALNEEHYSQCLKALEGHEVRLGEHEIRLDEHDTKTVSYTHLRAHET